MDANPQSAPPVMMREMDAAEQERLNGLIQEVIGAVYEVARTLGAGFLEKCTSERW